jgi:antitoxin component of MazEF toxin-antitoxin module
MLKSLIKSGSSKVLVISKEMLAHLGLEEDRIDVQYVEGRIILSRPPEESSYQTLENLPQTAFEKFETNEHGW